MASLLFSTVKFCFNTVNFFQIFHSKNPKACPRSAFVSSKLDIILTIVFLKYYAISYCVEMIPVTVFDSIHLFNYKMSSIFWAYNTRYTIYKKNIRYLHLSNRTFHTDNLINQCFVWLTWRLSAWQLPMELVMTKLSSWLSIHFSNNYTGGPMPSIRMLPVTKPVETGYHQLWYIKDIILQRYTCTKS